MTGFDVRRDGGGGMGWCSVPFPLFIGDWYRVGLGRTLLGLMGDEDDISNGGVSDNPLVCGGDDDDDVNSSPPS